MTGLANAMRTLKGTAKAEAQRRRHAEVEAAQASRAAVDAERQVRSLVLDRDGWKTRAEAAEARLRSMGYAP